MAAKEDTGRLPVILRADRLNAGLEEVEKHARHARWHLDEQQDLLGTIQSLGMLVHVTAQAQREAYRQLNPQLTSNNQDLALIRAVDRMTEECGP